MTQEVCLFCDRYNSARHKLIHENELAYSRWDNFPVNPGHVEIVPKRHVVSFFDLTDGEVFEIFQLMKTVKVLIHEKFQAPGYNIGINEGEAAGRTVHHLHIHIIPRYIGDVANPRGGIRNIIPGKGDY